LLAFLTFDNYNKDANNFRDSIFKSNTYLKNSLQCIHIRGQMKIGFIRCMKSSDMIPAVDSLMELLNKNGINKVPAAQISLSGLDTCGGCPGLKA
jgi:hypothetical protein